MTRRFDFGALVCGLGALLLLVALFLDWFGSANAWQSFELADVALAGLAVAALAGVGAQLELLAAGTAGEAGGRGQRLPLYGVVALAIVGVQVADPPSTVGGADAEAGAWLALGASGVMVLGALLSLLRLTLHVTPRTPDPGRQFEAVDQRRAQAEAPAPAAPAVQPAPPAPPRPPDSTPTSNWPAVAAPAWAPPPPAPAQTGWEAAPVHNGPQQVNWPPEHPPAAASSEQPPTMPLEAQPRTEPTAPEQPAAEGDADGQAEARSGTEAPDDDGG